MPNRSRQGRSAGNGAFPGASFQHKGCPQVLRSDDHTRSPSNDVGRSGPAYEHAPDARERAARDSSAFRCVSAPAHGMRGRRRATVQGDPETALQICPWAPPTRNESVRTWREIARRSRHHPRTESHAEIPKEQQGSEEATCHDDEGEASGKEVEGRGEETPGKRECGARADQRFAGQALPCSRRALKGAATRNPAAR